MKLSIELPPNTSVNFQIKDGMTVLTLDGCSEDIISQALRQAVSPPAAEMTILQMTAKRFNEYNLTQYEELGLKRPNQNAYGSSSYLPFGLGKKGIHYEWEWKDNELVCALHFEHKDPELNKNQLEKVLTSHATLVNDWHIPNRGGYFTTKSDFGPWNKDKWYRFQVRIAAKAMTKDQLAAAGAETMFHLVKTTIDTVIEVGGSHHHLGRVARVNIDGRKS